MEEHENSSWNLASTWIVADGALENSVSFESSTSPIEEDAVVPSGDLLVLNSPSPDAGPCEITVTFGQEHEVHQVYVKSTARIYEIYYLPCKQSCNEYLCTVRCGVAAKEEKLLNVGDTREDPSRHAESSEVKDKTENISSSSEEDGWVEVKNPESSSSCNSGNSILEEIDENISRANQDFYEATAEITDASPCVSITLRFLSLHSKGCVHIDNIYIFADPTESGNSSPQLGSTESSAGSSLLTLLVPSLLQLSKSETGRTHDRNTSDILLRYGLQGGMDMTKPTHCRTGNTMQQEHNSKTTGLQVERTLDVAVEREEPMNVACGKQTLESVSKEETLVSSSLERVLNQLDSRIGRIEAFCSRFEENMLKLLSSTETRFQQLEQRLDALAMRNTLSSTSFISSRIVAPEFSCEESETNSIQKDTNEASSIDSVKDLKSSLQDKLVLVNNLEAHLEDAAAISSPHLCPTLVITAPEFSNDDESQSGDELSELVGEDPPMEKPAISIDDALASALSAFIISASIESHKLHPSPNQDTHGNLEFGLPSAVDEVKDTKVPGPASLHMKDTTKLLTSDDFQEDRDFKGQENTQVNCLEEVTTLEWWTEHDTMDQSDTSMVIDDDVPCENGVESNLPSFVAPDTQTVRPTVLLHETSTTDLKSGINETQHTAESGKLHSSGSQDFEDRGKLSSPMAVVCCQNAVQNREPTETGSDQGLTSNRESFSLEVKFVRGDDWTPHLPLEALLCDTMLTGVTEVQTSGCEDKDASLADPSSDVHILGVGAELLIDTENMPSDNKESNGHDVESFPSLI
ncbi:uncharacterized protein [Aristolochia californica]|uniref:uncharacterized protein n=1 Tax=Aristolochia californica TaxID=171875 RepID=UPI0035D6B7E2